MQSDVTQWGPYRCPSRSPNRTGGVEDGGQTTIDTNTHDRRHEYQSDDLHGSPAGIRTQQRIVKCACGLMYWWPAGFVCWWGLRVVAGGVAARRRVVRGVGVMLRASWRMRVGVVRVGRSRWLQSVRRSLRLRGAMPQRRWSHTRWQLCMPRGWPELCARWLAAMVRAFVRGCVWCATGCHTVLGMCRPPRPSPRANADAEDGGTTTSAPDTNTQNPCVSLRVSTGSPHQHWNDTSWSRMCPWVGGLLGCWVGVLVGFGGVGRGWGTTMFTIVV